MAPAGHLEFEGLLGERRIAARSELAQVIRMLSTENLPDVAKVDAELPVDAFFEPRLYSQLAVPGFESMTLSQLTLSKASDQSGSRRVRTDKAGIATFPGIGHIATGMPDADLTATYSPAKQAFSFPAEDGVEKWCEVRTSTFVPNTQIEIIEHIDPVLVNFLEQHIDAPENLKIVDNPQRYVESISKALGLIDHAGPDFHTALVESLQAILLFQHPSAESFAALGMHGMLFLNVPADAGINYFVEEITHQGGHVLFSEATLNRGEFFIAEPEAALSDFLGDSDPRSIYDAFHGLYTEHMESQIVLAVLDRELGVDGLESAFRRHLDAVLLRHARDLSLIGKFTDDIFSPLGKAVFMQFQDSYDHVIKENPHLLGVALHA